MGRAFRMLAGAIVAAAAFAIPLTAAAEKTVLMVGGSDKQIYLPATLAQRLGYFRDQGLDVALESEPSGVEITFSHTKLRFTRDSEATALAPLQASTGSARTAGIVLDKMPTGMRASLSSATAGRRTGAGARQT